MERTPRISILIPARNEEDNLLRTLKSLDNLVYPLDSLEVLLGNDNSEDGTGSLLDLYAVDKSWVRVVHLKEKTDADIKGKTRVLANLADMATGEYLFFTDADVSINPKWIDGMLQGFSTSENIGVVVGVTGYKKDTVLSAVQGIEWFMALAMFKISADFGLSSTGLGNNMAVSKKAYDTIGGYRAIGFSIVEDFLLYDRIIKAGFGFNHAFNPDIVSYTLPPKNYFEQRKRWIKGALENKPTGMLAGIIQAMIIPILIILGFINPLISLVLIGVLIFTYGGLIIFFEKKLNLKGYLKWLPFFAIYISTAWFLQFIYFLLKKDTVWKGRKY